MSPMLVYFLMMADDIKSTAGVLAFFLLLVTAAAVIFYIVARCGEADNARKMARWPKDSEYMAEAEEFKLIVPLAARIMQVTLALLFVTGSINTFMPGTKTIAAMVVLPKITSPQALDAMGNEAKELYGLAKDALRNLAGDDKPAKSDK